MVHLATSPDQGGEVGEIPHPIELRIQASAGRTTDRRKNMLSFARKFVNLLIAK